jgi:hypothetical protein
MSIQSDTFWWEDCNCLTTIQEKKVAPICQHEIAPTSTAATSTESSTSTTSTPTTTKITTTTAKTTTVAPCEGDRTEYNGHRYFISAHSGAWMDAENCCIAEGGHLASIHSKEEEDFIFSLTGLNPTRWIGGRYSALEVISMFLFVAFLWNFFISREAATAERRYEKERQGAIYCTCTWLHLVQGQICSLSPPCPPPPPLTTPTPHKNVIRGAPACVYFHPPLTPPEDYSQFLVISAKIEDGLHLGAQKCCS